jgi:hypothetical protein
MTKLGWLFGCLALTAGLAEVRAQGPFLEPGECMTCGRCPRCGRDAGSAGCFNCSCHGSYKYPVPPQYTYFWPGMYAQPCMTQYVSPYRVTSLNPPEVAFPAPVPATSRNVPLLKYEKAGPPKLKPVAMEQP